MATHLRVQNIQVSEQDPFVDDYFVPAEPANPLPRSMEWDATYTPSWTNIFWGPISLVSTIMGLIRSQASGDQEGQFDAKLKLVGAPFTILHALCAALSSILRLAYLLHESLAKSLEPIVLVLGLPTVVFGLGLCVMEGIYEAICLFRSGQLICHTGSSEDSDETVIENLDYFKATYLVPSEAELQRYRHIEDQAQRQQMALAAKKVTLIRRVGLSCANNVMPNLRISLETLNNPDVSLEEKAAAIERAKGALSLIDAQAKKKLIIHAVGLAAIILCGLSFILAMVGCPALIPVILMTIGGVFATGNYIYAKGALDEEGWGFSLTKAFPPLGWILG